MNLPVAKARSRPGNAISGSATVRRTFGRLAAALAFVIGLGGHTSFASQSGAAAARHPAAGTNDSDRSGSACGAHDGILTHGRRDGSDIALTFDACPTSHAPGFAPAIADALEREHVPATFFVSGRWAEAHPRELVRLRSVPFFEIALHGYRHHHLVDERAVREEIEDGRSALVTLGADVQPLFRPPFGDSPPALAAIALRSGVTTVTWDVAPGDPVASETAAKLERDVLRGVRGGSIIILHANGRGIGTADAVPVLVARLRERGYRFVTVTELLRDCDVAKPAGESP